MVAFSTSSRISHRGRRPAALRHLARATGTGHGTAERHATTHGTISTTTLAKAAI